MSNTISTDVLENIFVTALEGGSNYWCYISKNSRDKIRNAVPIEECQYLAVAMLKAVLDHGVEVDIHDADDNDEVLGTISLSTIYDRLDRLSNDSKLRWCLESEIDENGDAETSDVCFQFIVMNDYVFG